MNTSNFDHLLARVAQPTVVLRAAALSVCVLELASAAATLLGYRTDAYDGVVPALWLRLGGSPNAPGLLAICLLLLGLFGWAYWQLARDSRADQPPPSALSRILLIDALALAVTPGLPFLVTALAALLLRVRTAFLFALGQVVLNVLLYWFLPQVGGTAPASLPSEDVPAWFDSLGLFMAMLALHGMAFGLGRMAAAEAEKRRWLQVMLAERLSAEALQAEHLRYSERTLMARELHDVVGHHLTALNLQLQLSSALLQRSDADGAAQAVDKAREGAARLLADVRVAVSQQRASQRIDLSSALQALADGIASTRIELDIAAAARDLSPRVAHALLRCAQEAVTNSVRHARAAHVRLTLAVDDSADENGEVRLGIADDGPGIAEQIVRGNGLKGMAERMNELGGSLQIRQRQQGRGLFIELRCPRTA